MDPVIALLGPPASGKGTHAERLRDDELGFREAARFAEADLAYG